MVRDHRGSTGPQVLPVEVVGVQTSKTAVMAPSSLPFWCPEAISMTLGASPGKWTNTKPGLDPNTSLGTGSQQQAAATIAHPAHHLLPTATRVHEKLRQLLPHGTGCAGGAKAKPKPEGPSLTARTETTPWLLLTKPGVSDSPQLRSAVAPVLRRLPEKVR